LQKNRELADIFERIADALTIKGKSGFRVLACRKAAKSLRELTESIEDLDTGGRLDDVPGPGSGLARKAREFLSTGRVAKLAEATAGLPPGLFELLRIQGVGPKTVKLAFEQVGVTDPTGLRQAIEAGRLSTLPGMGAKRSANILQGIGAGEHASERM
jgi:DNA polymerase (family 10)